MRNIRNAAVAAIAASAIALTGTTAIAQEAERPVVNDQKADYSQLDDLGKNYKEIPAKAEQDAIKNDLKNGTSSHVGKLHDSETKVTGEALLGSSVSESTPNWAKLWRDGTTVGVIGGILGFIVAAFNLAKYQGLIPHNFPF